MERHAPLLGLHGHIHESKGFVRIGRTLCLNPESEYSDGMLRGPGKLADGKVHDFVDQRLGGEFLLFEEPESYYSHYDEIDREDFQAFWDRGGGQSAGEPPS
jgi:hypothetical protein